MRTPAERRLASSIGGQVTALRHDMKALGERSVAARLSRWEREADPDGTLTPEARAAKAAQLQRLHMTTLSLRAAQARKAGR